MNVIDFFMNTYEEDIESSNSLHDKSCDHANTNAHQGHRHNERVSYLCSHPKCDVKQQVIQSEGHNNLPNFIGHYFPNRDDEDVCDFYHVSILMLLKPWQDIGVDLKVSSDTWAQSFDQFMEQLTSEQKHVKDIMSGIQYFHSCKGSVEKDVDEFDEGGKMHVAEDCHDQLMKGEKSVVLKEITEEALHDLLRNQMPLKEALHARLAIETMMQAHIFTEDDDLWPIHHESMINMGSDLEVI